MELRVAFRNVLRRPAVFTAIAVAIALAIAINAALFSVVDGLLLRPLPFQQPDRIVTVNFPRSGNRLSEIAYLPEFADRRRALREAVDASPLIAASAQAGSAAFFSPIAAQDAGLQAHGVDSHFFRLLGLAPIVGADFTAEDERSPAAASRDSHLPLPLIISHEVWRRLYGASPDVLGVKELAGRPVRIVGVMGRGVKFPDETNVWAPVAATRDRPPAYVRLLPRATIEQLRGAFPDLQFTPLREAIRPGAARTLLVVFAAAGLLLLITWIQVAALMFSAAVERLPEIGVRLALGAGRIRLIRQFALESAFVVGAAFVIAWMATPPLTAIMIGVLPTELYRGQYLEPDFRTFLFGCVVSIVGVGLLSTFPIGVIRRVTPHGLLSGRMTATPIRINRLRRVLLVSQVTLTAALLYLSGLATHSYMRAVTFDYGFDADHVLVFTPPPWARVIASNEQQRALFAERNRKVAESIESLRTVPGVIGATSFVAAPLGVGITPQETAIVSYGGRPLLDVRARHNTVGADFVRTLGARIIAGESFDHGEHAGQHNVAIVNETLARRLSPAIAVIGDQLIPSVIGREVRTPFFRGRIIGIIKDLVDSAPAIPPNPQLFTPATPTSAAAIIVVRVGSSTDAALPAVHVALQRIWGDFSPRQFSLLTDEMRRVLTPYRAQSLLLGLIATLCLPVAAVGLAGALTYFVQVRNREMAIRIALGAHPVKVGRAVVRHALATVCIGLGLGIAAGIAAGSLMAHRLFHVRSADAVTIGGVSVALLVLCWLAAVLPARQAARIEPVVALRHS